MQSGIKLPPPESIRDSLEPIELPAHIPPYAPIFLGIALVIVVALATLWILRRRQQAFGSPISRAKSRLSLINPDVLSRRDLFGELRSILADYLTATAGITAIKQTSPEILQSLRAVGLAGLPEIEAFLDESDRARFSASGQATTASRAAIVQCRLIIDGVEILMKGRPRDGAV